ncbi:MAG: hypothetical protein WC455_12390 [Dehalococcoidia bacterium]|jgi:hypothetical protein
MTDKLPQGAVEAAGEIRMRLSDLGYPLISPCHIDQIATIIAGKVRPITDAWDNIHNLDNPEEVEPLRIAIKSWQGEK